MTIRETTQTLRSSSTAGYAMRAYAQLRVQVRESHAECCNRMCWGLAASKAGGPLRVMRSGKAPYVQL